MDEMKHMILESEETLAKAMSDILQTKKTVVVTKNGEYYGMIDESSIRKLSDDPTTVKAGRMAVPAPTISKDTTLLDACKLFFTSRMKALPLVKGKKVLGLMAFSELLNMLAEEGVLEGNYVKESMSRPGVRIEKDSTLAQAQATMRKNHVKRLIVTDNGMLAGILSTYDMASLMTKPYEKVPQMREKIGMKEMSIISLMRPDVATVPPAESLTNAAKKMAKLNVASLVVVEADKPVGIITAHDILEVVFGKDEPNIYISGLYGENKSFYPEVLEYSKKEITKFERSGKVEYLSLHFKFRNRRCTAKARLRMEHMFNVSASGYGALETLKALMKELGVLVKKRKQKSK